MKKFLAVLTVLVALIIISDTALAAYSLVKCRNCGGRGYYTRTSYRMVQFRGGERRMMPYQAKFTCDDCHGTGKTLVYHN